MSRSCTNSHDIPHLRRVLRLPKQDSDEPFSPAISCLRTSKIVHKSRSYFIVYKMFVPWLRTATFFPILLTSLATGNKNTSVLHARQKLRAKKYLTNTKRRTIKFGKPSLPYVVRHIKEALLHSFCETYGKFNSSSRGFRTNYNVQIDLPLSKTQFEVWE